MEMPKPTPISKPILISEPILILKPISIPEPVLIPHPIPIPETIMILKPIPIQESSSKTDSGPTIRYRFQKTSELAGIDSDENLFFPITSGDNVFT